MKCASAWGLALASALIFWGVACAQDTVNHSLPPIAHGTATLRQIQEYAAKHPDANSYRYREAPYMPTPPPPPMGDTPETKGR